MRAHVGRPELAAMERVVVMMKKGHADKMYICNQSNRKYVPGELKVI